MSEKYPRRKLAPGRRCEYEGCDFPVTDIACGEELWGDEPGHPNPGLYCDVHAAMVSGERHPEYVETCPNCGCAFGVN